MIAYINATLMGRAIYIAVNNCHLDTNYIYVAGAEILFVSLSSR